MKYLVMIKTLILIFFIGLIALPTFAQNGEYVEVFTETFSPTNKLGWPLNSNERRTTSIENLKYTFNTTMSSEKASLIARDVDFLLPEDYAIETDFYFSKGDGSGYGLIFNYSDPSNFHTINLSSNGYYRYGYYINGQWVNVVNWSQVPLNGTGSNNSIRLEFRNQRMIIKINGDRVNELPNPTEFGTKMGFIVYGKQIIQIGRLSVFEDRDELTVVNRSEGTEEIKSDAEKEAETKQAEQNLQVGVASTSDYPNKYALIIGNSDYKNSPLKNPKNDALAMSSELEAVGFKVTTVINADRTAFRQAIVDFSKDMNQNPGVGLFYYAGHGLQSQGINYLVPVGAQIEAEFEIEDECIRADRVLRMLNSLDNPLNIIILDACRNNPYASAYRSGSRGLAMPEFAPTGSILAFATAPGKTASDGDGENGLYTQEFIEAMKVPGLSIEEVFKMVRINVSKKSAGQQIPWENSSLMGDFYFKRN